MGTRRVIIAGAGISGLALAHDLRARGLDPLVLEQAPRAGGKIHSEQRAGYLCEWGPAGLQGDEPAVQRLRRELALDGRVEPAQPAARRRFVVAEGELMPVPTSPRQLLRTRLLGPAAKLRALGDLVLGRGPVSQGSEESVAAFARRRLGRSAAERVLYPLVSGLYAGDPEQISVGDAVPWLAALEQRERSLIVGGLRKLWQARGQQRRGLISFKRGLEELTAALARELGPRLRLDTVVETVTRDRGQLQLGVRQGGERRTLEADAVVLALPAPQAAAVVAPLSPALPRVLGAIPYVPVVLVHLGYAPGALARPPDGYGFLVAPDEPPGLLGAVFASSVFSQRAPLAHALVSTRLGGARNPELVHLSDAELTQLAMARLTPLLGARQEPAFVRVVRHVEALPQYTLGHAARIAAIDAAEQHQPGLYFTGNAYRGLGIPDCIRNAATLAQRIAREVTQARAHAA